MPRGPSQDTPAVTRSQVEENNKLWESYQALYTKSMADLHLFATETAPASLQRLTDVIHDTDEPENLWEIWSRIKFVTNQEATYKRKIKSVENVLASMEESNFAGFSNGYFGKSLFF